MALTILFLLLLVEGWGESADTQSEHTHVTHTHVQMHQHWQLMAAISSRLLGGNWVNGRVSATEWPLDHPFYCLTNSPCLRHLTAQRDPPRTGEKDREGGGKLNSSRVMEAAQKTAAGNL